VNRYNATLHFDSMQNAMDAGYCDAVYLDDDIPELGCQAVITFHCDGYEIEPDDESLEVDEVDITLESLADTAKRLGVTL
jgi:hypothetical protein